MSDKELQIDDPINYIDEGKEVFSALEEYIVGTKDEDRIEQLRRLKGLWTYVCGLLYDNKLARKALRSQTDDLQATVSEKSRQIASLTDGQDASKELILQLQEQVKNLSQEVRVFHRANKQKLSPGDSVAEIPKADESSEDSPIEETPAAPTPPTKKKSKKKKSSKKENPEE